MTDKVRRRMTAVVITLGAILALQEVNRYILDAGRDNVVERSLVWMGEVTGLGAAGVSLIAVVVLMVVLLYVSFRMFGPSKRYRI